MRAVTDHAITQSQLGAVSMADQDFVEQLLSEWRKERPDIDPWPIGVLAGMLRLSGRIVRQSEAWLEPLGLTWEAFSLIVTLRRAGQPHELRPKDILRQSLLSSGTVTNRVDRVEQMGLVERRADPEDRRGVVIRLTSTGRRLADRAIALHVAALADILSGLTPVERNQLLGLLGKLSRSIATNAAHTLGANGAPSKQGIPRSSKSGARAVEPRKPRAGEAKQPSARCSRAQRSRNIILTSRLSRSR